MTAELDWLASSHQSLERRDLGYLSKRLSADRSRKSRGYTSRTQGGEITGDPAGGSPDHDHR
jgi:hypothetical protein